MCAGARARCQAGAFAACTGVADYGPDYEAVETRCDTLDNDCDGVADRDCPCDPGAARVCGRDEGECRPGEQQCVDGQWGPCVGETTPGAEVCNGKDNDCDGLADEDLDGERPDCPLTQGVCVGARAKCRGALGYADCGGCRIRRPLGGRGVRRPTATPWTTTATAARTRAARAATARSRPAGWTWAPADRERRPARAASGASAAARRAPPRRACDGHDNDCDGQTDEGLPPLACPLQAGVCAGAGVDCADTGGRAECDADVYAAHSPRWVSVETDAHCDGLDNDCDGLTDEACQCVDGDAQVCGQNVGQCTQGRQVCVGGRFGRLRRGRGHGRDLRRRGQRLRRRRGRGRPHAGLPARSGVCAGASALCTRGEIVPCGAEAYGPAWQAAETFCDQRDNDCDGETDEGCDCVDNAVQACGSDTGACTRGMQTCVGGRWGPCEGEIPPVARGLQRPGRRLRRHAGRRAPGPALPVAGRHLRGRRADVRRRRRLVRRLRRGAEVRPAVGRGRDGPGLRRPGQRLRRPHGRGLRVPAGRRPPRVRQQHRRVPHGRITV